MKNLTPFGKEIRKLRVDRGETQADVANAVGVSVAFFSAIETGRKNVPGDLLDNLMGHFQLDMVSRARIKRIAEDSQIEVKINMKKFDDERRHVVAGFARKFDELSDQQLEELKAILGLDKECK